ncbi:MAG: MazG family protein [Microbacteriaceae bacterium]
MTEPNPRLDELVALLAQLRAPGGCAWDREQTHASLVQYLIEETHELVDAIETGDDSELIEELGDVLYQVLFHADIAQEAGRFTLEDVAAHMTQKMVGRHPHVFGDESAATSAEVVELWDKRKKIEKPGRMSVLDGIPQGMPSLALAHKLLGRAAKVELGSPAEPPQTHAPQTLPNPTQLEPGADEAALGDLLLGIVASAKANGLDAERALRSRLRALQQEIRQHEEAMAQKPEL